MILILSGAGDPHAEEVGTALQRRNVATMRFDPARCPDRATAAVHLDAGGMTTGWLHFDGTVLAFDDIDAVWVRRPGRPTTTHHRLGERGRNRIAAETGAVLADVWELLDLLGSRFVPGSPDAIAHAAHKSRQLALAGRLGFTVPPTLTGNDPDRLLDFVGDGPSSFVTKRSAPGQRLEAADGEEVARYTQPLRPRDLTHVESVRACPFTVQQAVPKAVELRVTVVGEQVFAAAIHSQASNHTRHDWRRFDHAHTRITPFALPGDTSSRCRALVDALGLRYGAIDLILTPDGDLVFLEINPNGQYLWIEQVTGLPITDALADLLTGSAARVPPTVAVPTP